MDFVLSIFCRPKANSPDRKCSPRRTKTERILSHGWGDREPRWTCAACQRLETPLKANYVALGEHALRNSANSAGRLIMVFAGVAVIIITISVVSVVVVVVVDVLAAKFSLQR